MARALTVLVLVAVLPGAGCGGGDGESDLRLQVFGDAEELAVYREVVGAYEQRTGRRVTLVEVPDRGAHLTKLSTSFAAGSPPEVFLINYRNFAGYADRGVLEAVEARLAASRSLRREAFYPAPLEAFTHRGRLQCLPQNASSLVTYYNRDLFRAAGLDDPADNWTYDDFRAAATRLTEDTNGDGAPDRYGVGLDPETIRLAPFVWAAGGELVDDDDDPTGFTLDAPAAREGLQSFLDLQAGDRLAPSEVEVDAKPLEERFRDGQVAMFLSSRREVPSFRTIEGFTWDVAAFPRQAEATSVLHSDAYCIARGARAREAWRFVEFAAGPEGQRILARGGRIVPSLRAVAESKAFLDPSKPPRSGRVFLDAIDDLRRLPNAVRWPAIEEAADLALKRAYYNELTVDQALARIRTETDELFREP